MEQILSNLAIGFQNALTLTNIMWVIIGGFLGTVIGMLPGLGPATGVAVLIPISYGMDPTTALITMCAIYYGAMFGGSRSSIMINTPGDGSAIVTCFDGYPMTQQGRGGEALAISAIASFIGGLIAVVMMVLLTLPIANFALKFGPAEMFALLFFALTATVTLAKGNLIKGFVSLFIGFMISSIGIDIQSGITRFTFGIPDLQDGIDFLVAIIGLYAITEVFKNYSTIHKKYKIDSKSIGRVWVSKKDFKKCLWPIIRSTPLGFVVGVLPGMGGSVATLMAYATEKQLSKNPDEFGKGEIVGVAAPEAANNAASTGAIIPLLTMGIPGSGTTAVMLGALMMLGVRPGPLLFEQHPQIAWGVIASMFIGNIFLIIMNLPLVVPLVKLLAIPQRILLPIIAGLAFMGTYLMNYSSFDFILLVFFGIVGYIMWKLDIPIPPMVLSLILGSTLEKTLRQAMVASNGSISVFFTKPISLTLIILAVLSLMYSIYRDRPKKQKTQKATM